MPINREQRRARRREIAAFSTTHTDGETARKFCVCDKTVKDSRREFGMVKQMFLVQQPSKSTISVLSRLINGERQIDIAMDIGVTKQWVNAVYKSAKAKGIVFGAARQGKPKRGTRP